MMEESSDEALRELLADGARADDAQVLPSEVDDVVNAMIRLSKDVC